MQNIVFPLIHVWFWMELQLSCTQFQTNFTAQITTSGLTVFTLGVLSGFNDRRTRENTLWASSSPLDLSRGSCSTFNNFRGAPGSGDRLWTNKCLTLGSFTSSPCIIPAAENNKQPRSTKLARTSFSIFSFDERVLASGLRLVRN